MIAQILTKGRRGFTAASRSASLSDESRALGVGAHCVRVGLAILLLPALATALVVGGIGAVAVGLATAATRAWDEGRRSTSP